MARFEEGSKVEGNYRGRGKWYPGKISRDRGDGTYDIKYDDGESESRVEKDMIRLVEDAKRRPSRSRSPVSRRSNVTLFKDKYFIENFLEVCKRYLNKSSDNFSLVKAFEVFDESVATGVLSKREFKTALKSLYDGAYGSRGRSDLPFDEWISDETFATLQDSYATKNGGISYVDLILYALDSRESDEVIEVHDKIQKDVSKKLKTMRYKEVSQLLFSSYKGYGTTGHIKSSDFEKALRKWSSKTLSSEEVESIVARFDINKDGEIDYNSFSAWLCIGSTPKESMAKLIRQLVLLSYDAVDSNLSEASTSSSSSRLLTHSLTLTH